MPDRAFADDDELFDWVKEQCQPWVQEHPPKIVKDNVHLCEFWIERDQGQDRSHASKVQEQVQRQATDASAALKALEDEQAFAVGKKVKQPAEIYKAAVSRLNGLMNRYAKVVNSVESSLGSLKHNCSAQEYAQFRAGLEEVRRNRESTLVALEEHKEVPDEEWMESQLQSVNSLHAVAAAHLKTLQEAFQKMKKPASPIKEEQKQLQLADRSLAEDGPLHFFTALKLTKAHLRQPREQTCPPTKCMPHILATFSQSPS